MCLYLLSDEIVRPMTILGIFTSLTSCAVACTNIFLFQREGYYGGDTLSAKTSLIYLVFIYCPTVSILALWSFAFYYASFIAGGIFIANILLTLGLVLSCSPKRTKMRDVKTWSTEVASSWLAPYSPWIKNRKMYFLQFFIKFTCLVILPVGATIFREFWFGTDVVSFGYTHYCILASVAFLVSLLIQFMADYDSLFGISKYVFKPCCLKPIVHRSLVFDFIKGTSEGIFKHIFLMPRETT